MDWSVIGNQLLDMLLPILATFLTGLFTYIGTRLKKVYEEKVNTETAKQVAEDAVTMSLTDSLRVPSTCTTVPRFCLS